VPAWDRQPRTSPWKIKLAREIAMGGTHCCCFRPDVQRGHVGDPIPEIGPHL
jgi:hypothetical protein